MTFSPRIAFLLALSPVLACGAVPDDTSTAAAVAAEGKDDSACAASNAKCKAPSNDPNDPASCVGTPITRTQFMSVAKEELVVDSSNNRYFLGGGVAVTGFHSGIGPVTRAKLIFTALDASGRAIDGRQIPSADAVAGSLSLDESWHGPEIFYEGEDFGYHSLWMGAQYNVSWKPSPTFTDLGGTVDIDEDSGGPSTEKLDTITMTKSCVRVTGHYNDGSTFAFLGRYTLTPLSPPGWNW